MKSVNCNLKSQLPETHVIKTKPKNKIPKSIERESLSETVRDIFSDHIYKPMKNNNAKKTFFESKHELISRNGNLIEFRVFSDKDLGLTKDIQHIIIAKECDDDVDSDEDTITNGVNETIEDFKIALRLNRNKMDCLSESTEEDSNN